MPIEAFTLWSLVKECLRVDTGDEKWAWGTPSTVNPRKVGRVARLWTDWHVKDRQQTEREEN